MQRPPLRNRDGEMRIKTYAEARRLDPTRPVTLVGVKQGVREWHGIFDVVCVNTYYGWYTQAGPAGRQIKVTDGTLKDKEG